MSHEDQEDDYEEDEEDDEDDEEKDERKTTTVPPGTSGEKPFSESLSLFQSLQVKLVCLFYNHNSGTICLKF